MPNYILPSPPDERDYPVARIAPDERTPPSVRLDHRIQKVLNQGFCGTCAGKTGNAILSADHKTDLSSLFLYSRAKELDGIPHIEGTYPRVLLKVMHQEGSCPEHMLPYEDLKVCLQPPQITPEQALAATPYKIDSYARCRNLTDIKRAIANGELVFGAILVADNFIRYREGIIEPPTGQEHGYHAVVFCGYDDTVGAVRGVNSWGTRWGEDGYFWLSYDYFDNVAHFIEAWAVKTIGQGQTKEELPMEPSKWKSRKFWLAVVAAVFVVLNEGLGLGLPEETITAFVILILGWLGVEGTADVVSRYKDKH